MSCARVFEWHKRFTEGRMSVEDDQRTGRPNILKTYENVERINGIVREDRRSGYETLSIDKDTVWKILRDELNMKKVCAKMVPKLLRPDQKERRKELCADILQQIYADPDLLKKVVTCDETWIFQYDPETKRQSMHWKTPSSPRMKKSRQCKSKFKSMLIALNDIRGIILLEWLPEGTIVNQYYYKEVLLKLRERIRRKRS